MKILCAAVLLAGCGGGAGVGADASMAASLGMRAFLHVDLRDERGVDRTFVSAMFWDGPNMPAAGGLGGRSIILDASRGESVTLNGVPLVGGHADWAYLYGGAVPDPVDGQWKFRVTRGGQTGEVSLSARRAHYIDLPQTPQPLGRGFTLRWSPPFAAGTERKASLSSSVLDPSAEVGTDSVAFRGGQLTAQPCRSQAEVIASQSVTLGPPFDGGSAQADVWIARDIDLVP